VGVLSSSTIGISCAAPPAVVAGQRRPSSNRLDPKKRGELRIVALDLGDEAKACAGMRRVGFALFLGGHVMRSVAAVSFVAVLTVGLAVLMGVLLPGSG
jgi:hypothetical protein